MAVGFFSPIPIAAFAGKPGVGVGFFTIWPFFIGGDGTGVGPVPSITDWIIRSRRGAYRMR